MMRDRTYEELKRFYLDDPTFHALVDVMFHTLVGQQISIPELRAAVTFAINKFAVECMDVSPVFYYGEWPEGIARLRREDQASDTG